MRGIGVGVGSVRVPMKRDGDCSYNVSLHTHFISNYSPCFLTVRKHEL